MTKPLRCKLGFHKYDYTDVGVRFATGQKLVQCKCCRKTKVIGWWR